MARSAVELDFFRMEKETVSAPKRFDGRRSFRDIQNVVTKINPQVLKTLIASASANGKEMETYDPKASFSVPSTPTEDPTYFPALPVYLLNSRSASASGKLAETAPLTIFYNGTVAVFDVPRHKAENILKLAEEGASRMESKLGVSSSDRQLLETFNGDLPLARKKSLQRFLEKRKERLTLASPYGCLPYEDQCQYQKKI